ncbi:MAG: hypothetical protein KDH88_19440 [Chromatiales bacterium]|nr:hypothetical protein [Chromatiales bacterium]
MFFTDSRTHFFRPLTGKYRAQIVECLRELYGRLYGGSVDYSRHFHRDLVIEVFQEAIARAPLLAEGTEDEFSPPVRPGREQAVWVLNLLLEHGWLERLVDEASMRSSYAFSRMGRLFTQPMVEAGGARFRTRHRNTRNTRNALLAFLDNGEVYDLLDAYEHSERIVSDFSDVIAELDERKRQLVQAVEMQQYAQRAGDDFFDFMEKRFMPDLAIRLSADSVEKYRGEIGALLGKARRKAKEFKVRAERDLRKLTPELIQERERSVYLAILDGIEGRMHNAAAVMLPALRSALNGYTRRADLIIRQLSYTGGSGSRLLDACQTLRELSVEEQDRRLAAAGEAMASLSVEIADPDSLRLLDGRGQRTVNPTLEQGAELSRDARRDLYIQQAVELAFSVNDRELRQYVRDALGVGRSISSRDLPVRDAKELLFSGHLVEVAASSAPSGEFRFRVSPTGEQVETAYFESCDEFVIELQEVTPDVE